MWCNSCNIVSINGMACHEIGCPDAWKDYARDCKECGLSFTPETSQQICCDEDCNYTYYS